MFALKTGSARRDSNGQTEKWGQNLVVYKVLLKNIGRVFSWVPKDTDFCIKLCQYQLCLTPSTSGP